jgi:hypothetical protein
MKIKQKKLRGRFRLAGRRVAAAEQDPAKVFKKQPHRRA